MAASRSTSSCTFYVTMAAAGYVVEVLFGALGIIPTNRAVTAIGEGPTWNYTTVLNIVFLVVAAVLVVPLPAHGWPGDAAHDEYAEQSMEMGSDSAGHAAHRS